MVRIDIDGQVGNAYAILGLVKNYGRQLSWDADKIAEVREDMKRPGTYEGLVSGFNKAFDGIVELYSGRDEEGECFDEEYLD